MKNDKIYYTVDDYCNCYDECKVTEFMIGSVKCQQCEHCIESNREECYIRCKIFYAAIDE